MNTNMIPIPGYESLYSACESGNIWSHRTRKYLKPWLIGRGYEMVMLYKDGQKPAKFLTHRLVASCFISNPESLPEVNHINGQRRDNRPQNLEWVSSKQNKRHAWKAGLYTHSKLTDKEVDEIRDLCEKGVFQKDIARMYGITQPHVSFIKLRKGRNHDCD